MLTHVEFALFLAGQIVGFVAMVLAEPLVAAFADYYGAMM